MRGKKYLLEKQSHGGAREKASPQNEDLKTSHKIAKETGVSHATIQRDAQLAQAVEDLEEIPKEIKKVYSVSEVAELLSVSRNTVFKWLSLDEPEFAVIPPDAWIRLPNSNHIRIKERAVKKLLGEMGE